MVSQYMDLGLVSWKMVASDRLAELATAGPCGGGAAGAITELSLFLEGLGHGQTHLQELRPRGRRQRILLFVRRGNHGQRPQPTLPRRPGPNAYNTST